MPTIIIQAGPQYFAQKLDGSIWCTVVTSNNQPDFSQAVQVQNTDPGGAGRAVSARNALRTALQIAMALDISPIVYIDGTQPS